MSHKYWYFFVEIESWRKYRIQYYKPSLNARIF